MKILNVEAENIELNKVHVHMVLEGMQDALKCAQTLHDLEGEEVDITAEKHRKKRSLSANSYFYVLCGKIADTIDSSKDEVHNLMLARYGQYLRDSNGLVVWVMYPDSMDYLKESELHLKPTGKYEDRGGVKYAWFAQMKPSHEYNTQEMAKLIDGVVSEAKELGIETLSPDELQRMKAAYGKEKDNG